MSLQQSMSVNTSLKNAMIFVYGAEEDSKLESNLKSSTTTTSTTLDSSNQKEERKQPTGNGGGGGVSSGKIVQRASNRFSRTSSVPYQRNASGNAKRNNSGQEMHGRSTSSRSPNDADADVSSTSSNQRRTDPAESQDTKLLQEAECSSSSSEGSSSRKSSCSRYSGKPENRQKREKDPDILNRRQKQIDYGKNTIGYDNYIRTVPRHERKFDDPRTPDKCRVYSRRAFDGLIKEWRLKLHKYDDA